MRLIFEDWGQLRMEFLRRFTPPDALRRTFKDFEDFSMSAKGERKSTGAKGHNDGFMERMDRTMHAMDQSLTPGMEEFMMHRYLESLTPTIHASVLSATATLSTPTLQSLMTVAVQVNAASSMVSLREDGRRGEVLHSGGERTFRGCARTLLEAESGTVRVAEAGLAVLRLRFLGPPGLDVRSPGGDCLEGAVGAFSAHRREGMCGRGGLEGAQPERAAWSWQEVPAPREGGGQEGCRSGRVGTGGQRRV